MYLRKIDEEMVLKFSDQFAQLDYYYLNEPKIQLKLKFQN